MNLIIPHPNHPSVFIKFSYESAAKLMEDLSTSAMLLGELRRKRAYLKIELNSLYSASVKVASSDYNKLLAERVEITEKLKNIKPIKSECGKRELDQDIFMGGGGITYTAPAIYTLEEWFKRD